jgi:N utilization substance protein B
MSQQRSQARSHAVQALYQWQMNDGNVAAIVEQFLVANPDSDFDVAYFRDLLSGVTGNLERLDAALAPHLDRSIASVDPVERAILRLGTYELADKPEIPYKVVINEAVDPTAPSRGTATSTVCWTSWHSSCVPSRSRPLRARAEPRPGCR